MNKETIKQKKISKTYKYLSKSYEQEEIGSYIYNIYKPNFANIIEQAVIYVESNDFLNFSQLIESINHYNNASCLSKKQMEILLCATMNMLNKNIEQYEFIEEYFTLINNILLQLKSKKEKINIDWRFFFNIYTLFKHYPELLMHHKTRKTFSLLKFFILESLNYEDYSLIKIELFKNAYIQNNTLFHFCILSNFISHKFLNQDKEMQMFLFNLMKNSLLLLEQVCQILKILFINKSTFFFDMSEFIQIFFARVRYYILENKFALPGPKDEKRKELFSVQTILTSLLFSNEFVTYRNVIERNLGLLIHEIEMKLKEEYADRKESGIVSFIKLLALSLKMTFTKNKEQIKYEENKGQYERYNFLMRKYFAGVILKLFLFKVKNTTLVLKTFFAIYRESNENVEYFTQYFDIFEVFEKNIDSSIAKYNDKFQIMLHFVFDDKIYSKIAKSKSFIIHSAELLIESISSVHSTLNIGIVKTLAICFAYLCKLKENPLIEIGKYKELISFFEEKSVIIMKKIVPILDLFLPKFKYISFLMNNMRRFVQEENKRKIDDVIITFIEENEVNSKYIKNYLSLIEKHEPLWRFFYDSMVYIDNSNAFEVKKHCLYKKELVSQIEIQIQNEKKLQYYQQIVANLNFETFDFIKYHKQYLKVIFGLFNQSEQKHFVIARCLLENLYSLLNMRIDKTHIDNIVLKYPSKKEIDFLLELYDETIKPYEDNITNINYDIKHTDEKILYLFLSLSSAFLQLPLNVFITYTTEQNSKDSTIISNDLMNTYSKVNALLLKSLTNVQKLLKSYMNYNDNIEKGENSENAPEIKVASIKLMCSIIQTNISSVNKRNLSSVQALVEEKNKIKYWLNFFSKEFDYSYLKRLIDNVKIFNFVISSFQKDITYIENIQILTKLLNQNTSINLSSIPYITSTFFRTEEFKHILNNIMVSLEQEVEKIKDDSDKVSDQAKLLECSKFYTALLRCKIDLFNYDILDGAIQAMRFIGKFFKKNFKYIGFLVLKMGDIFIISQIRMVGNYHIREKLCHIKLIPTQIYNELYNKKKEDLEEKITIHSKETEKSKEKNDEKYILFIEEIKASLLEQGNERELIKLLLLSFNQYNIILKFSLSNEKYINLYESIEKFFFDNYLNETSSCDIRALWFVLLRNLLSMKKSHFYIKKKVTLITDEDYQNKKIEFIRKVPPQKKLKTFPLTRQIIEDLIVYMPQIKGLSFQLKKIFNAMYQLSDWERDKSLMSKGSSDIISMFNKGQKGNFDFRTLIQGIASKGSVFFNKEVYNNSQFWCNLLFFKNISDYSEENIAEICKEQRQNETSCIKSKIEMLMGFALYEILISKNKEKGRKLLSKIREYHTNRIDKKIDDTIVKAYEGLIPLISIEDFEFLFCDDKLQMLLTFPTSLFIKMVCVLQKYSSENLQYLLYNNQDIKNALISKLNQTIRDILSKVKDFTESSSYLQQLIELYSYLTSSLSYDQQTFSFKYNVEFISYLKDIIINSKNQQNDNSQLRDKYTLIYSFFPNAFSENIDLLGEYLKGMTAIFAKEGEQNKILAAIGIFDRKISSSNNQIDPIDAMEKVYNEMVKEYTTLNQKGKMLYLVIIRTIYLAKCYYLPHTEDKGKKFFILLIKFLQKLSDDETLKDSFCEFLVFYYNCIDEEENEKIIKAIEEENEYSLLFKENNISNETIIQVVMCQLMRFRVFLPEYIQQFIIKVVKRAKETKNAQEKKSIKGAISKAMDRYHSGFIYMKEKISPECCEFLIEMSKNKSYFV